MSRPDVYRAIARIKVDRQVQQPGASDPIFSDPYFIQTEFEVMRSEVVLGRVVQKLDLASEWRNEAGSGDRREPGGAIELLRRQVDVRVVPRTQLVEIRINSSRAAEAAKLANAIAAAFRDFRLEQNQARKTAVNNANTRVTNYQVEIVDSAIAPVRPIRPNRPLAGVVGLLGCLLVLLGIYEASQG